MTSAIKNSRTHACTYMHVYAPLLSPTSHYSTYSSNCSARAPAHRNHPLSLRCSSRTAPSKSSRSRSAFESTTQYAIRVQYSNKVPTATDHADQARRTHPDKSPQFVPAKLKSNKHWPPGLVCPSTVQLSIEPPQLPRPQLPSSPHITSPNMSGPA